MPCTPEFSKAIAAHLDNGGHVAHGWAPRFEAEIWSESDNSGRPEFTIDIAYAGSDTPGISSIDAPECPCGVIVADHTDDRLASKGAAALITALTGIDFYGGNVR
jgi:hypothetical protein